MADNKNSLSYRRSLVITPKSSGQFNQFLPTKDKQSGYVPAPLRKKRAERNEDSRRSWASSSFAEDEATLTRYIIYPLKGAVPYLIHVGKIFGLFNCRKFTKVLAWLLVFLIFMLWDDDLSQEKISAPDYGGSHVPQSALPSAHPRWEYGSESGSDSDPDRPDPDLVLDDLASRRFHSPSPAPPTNFAVPDSPSARGRGGWGKGGPWPKVTVSPTQPNVTCDRSENMKMQCGCACVMRDKTQCSSSSQFAWFIAAMSNIFTQRILPLTQLQTLQFDGFWGGSDLQIQAAVKPCLFLLKKIVGFELELDFFFFGIEPKIGFSVCLELAWVS